jgi:GNAT superfamily N-acetyltransferase
MFDHLETYVAKEKGRIIGFAQVGHPHIAWDDRSDKYYDPAVSVLRHFYFEPDRLDAAEALYARTHTLLAHYPHRHAFYHIFGMSCNAYHGKLHEQLTHVNQFLLVKGFRVEHENVNYSVELLCAQQQSSSNLRLAPQARDIYGPQGYTIFLYDTAIGTVKVQFMDLLNGEAAKDAVYLSLMTIIPAYRGQGWGTLALKLLCWTLREKGYLRLHLDTASTNTGAQRFYERFGFQNRGRSRSYVHPSSGG